MTILLHPRLPREAARPRIETLRGLDLETITARVELLLTGHTFAPIGGRQIRLEEIEELRSEAVGIARGCGFPGRRGTEARVLFDKRIGRLLHERMCVTPHQAADEEIWTHISLGPFVDLAAWRFDGLPDERVLGRGPRNTFRRLWWRAEILGSLSWDEDRPLLEDETVQIMERPELSASPVVARALATAFHRRVAASPNVPRMSVMRDALKRTYRLTPFLRMESLTSQDLGALLDSVFMDAATSLDAKAAEVPLSSNDWERLIFTDDTYRADSSLRVLADDSPERGEQDEGPRTSGSPMSSGDAADSGTSDAHETVTRFEDLPLALVVPRIVEVVAANERIADDDLADAVGSAMGVEIPRKRRRLLNKLAWSAKGRGALVLDEETGIWRVGKKPLSADERFGDWSFAQLVDRAEELLAGDPEPFEQLLEEVSGGGRAPRIVASVVGTAINEAKRRTGASH